MSIDYTKVPRGHRHTHTMTTGRLFKKDEPTTCHYCETESYWREMIAREIEDFRTCLATCERHKEMDEECWECWHQLGNEQAAKVARGKM